MNKKKRNSVIVLLILSLFFIAVIWPKETTSFMKYTEFIERMEKGEIQEVDLLYNGEKIAVTLVSGEKYLTDHPKSTSFKEEILMKGISVKNTMPSVRMLLSMSSSLMSIGFPLMLVFLLYKTMGPALKEKNSLVKEHSKVNFGSIAGNIEAKEDMAFLVDFLKSPDAYQKIGAKLPKGIVLYGPPGTGKTLMAKAVAGEAGVPFYNISGSDFVEMYAGLGAKRVRDLFKEAKKNAPCIIFIDEIDAIGTQRGGHNGHAEKDQTINALLSELDGFNGNTSVIVMVATNRVEDLDPALIRPGRFDRHVNIGLPDYKDRRAILDIYAKKKKLSETIDLDNLAGITIGFSGASLEALMNEAAIIAVTKGSEIIREEDIEDSYFKITMRGNKKANKNEDGSEIELTAYHEAGHVLATKLLTDNHLHKVTIIPSTSGAGGATFSVPKKLNFITKKELLNNIRVLYAGRAAEELLKGNAEEITSGASSDIAQATKYINSYFSELGMSDRFGMLRINDEKLYMEDAIKLSNQLYRETLKFLKTNSSLLEKIANALIEKETLTGEDVETILNA